MWVLAEEAAAGGVARFHTFDIFVILFTIIMVVAVLKLLAAPVKNKFALGFATVSLLVFLFVDVVMVKNWMS